MSIQLKPRVNNRIRAREILVIDPEGKNLGVLRLEEALMKAREYGLDLIEISSRSNPVVCKIVDYGKYCYQLAKQHRDSKKHASTTKLKEIKFRPNIASHDYMTKVRNAEVFLDKGMKVKLTLMFRGREMQNVRIGNELMQKVREDLNHIGTVEMQPKLVGRAITMMIAPIPENKRMRKYSQPHEEEIEEHEENGEEES